MTGVLIVDDSLFVREQLKNIIAGDSELVVVGEASNGREAVASTLALHPHVIIMDVDMPDMDGIEATKQIMCERPTPILIHTSSAISKSRNLPFEAIQSGGLDIIEKPELYPFPEDERREFLNRLVMLSRIHVFRRPASAGHSTHSFQGPSTLSTMQQRKNIPKALAIGASTGGPKALAELFRLLPPVLPFPVLLVQHIGARFVEGFAEWLQLSTAVQIRLAVQFEPLLPNTCYLSPGNQHLTVRAPFNIFLDSSEPIHSCRPSVDVLFESMQRLFGPNAIGVLLTGIGDDGAHGLRSMHQAGAFTLAQDEESSVVFGMPRKAIELHAVSLTGNLEEIATTIQHIFRLNG